MYNGIGLITPRGSGTSGYVQRNLSALRVHDKNDDKSSWDMAPPRHREPDEAILEHERKRKVEVKCLELQDELEEKEVDEVEIERRVDELRQKLLANLAAETNSARRAFKTSDTHGMAVAKKTELEKMARALGTRGDYQEGDAFDREKQQEAKQRRIIEKQERETERITRREEDRKRMEEQKKRWQEERKRKEEEEGEQRRNRDDRGGDRKRDDKERGVMPPPDIPRREQPPRNRDREVLRRSPPRGPRGDRRDARDGPPRRNDMSARVTEAVRKRELNSPSRSRSRSPPRARRRVRSRTPSTSRSASTDSGVRRRRRDLSPRGPLSPMRGVRRGGRPVSRSASRSRFPPTHNPRRRDYDDRSVRSRSRSPKVPSRLGPGGRGKRGYTSRTPSRSPTPSKRVDQQPPTSYDGPKDRQRDGSQRGKERGRSRSRSASSGSSMSVSSRSASGSRSG